MLKTIKTVKHMRLDELIKYVWENGTNEKRVFLGNEGQRVVFDNVGGFYPSGYAYSPDTTFKVEIEEEITEESIFQELYSVYYSSEKSFRDIYNNASINDIILEDGKQGIETERIYALYKGKIELIWERENQ